LADHLLHQKWIVIVGIILGSISGLVFVVQTAVAAEKNSRKMDTTRMEPEGKQRRSVMTEETNPIIDLTQADLDTMLRRALRNTLILGLVAALAVSIGAGWRSGPCLRRAR